jgi:hypothetical protein
LVDMTCWLSIAVVSTVKALRLNVATCTSRVVTSKVKSSSLDLNLSAERSFKTMKRSLEETGSGAFKTDDILEYESTGGQPSQAWGTTLA